MNKISQNKNLIIKLFCKKKIYGYYKSILYNSQGLFTIRLENLFISNINEELYYHYHNITSDLIKEIYYDNTKITKMNINRLIIYFIKKLNVDIINIIKTFLFPDFVFYYKDYNFV